MSQPQDETRPTIKIRFLGPSKEKVPFSRHFPHENEDSPDHEKLFTSFIMVACEPQARSGVPIRTTCTFEEYHEWQKNYNKNSQSVITIYARNYPDADSTKRPPTPEEGFFLKVVPHADDTQAGRDLNNKLYDEASFYRDHLSSVQGKAVPIHYGVWEGKTQWGLRTVISIMQWGGLPYIEEIKKTGEDENGRALRMAVLEAYQILHVEAKVVHDKFSRTDQDIFHILYNKDLKKAFIVDFDRAALKLQCGLRMPLLKKYASTPPDTVFGCEELLAISLWVGMMRPAPYAEDPEVQKFVQDFDKQYSVTASEGGRDDTSTTIVEHGGVRVSFLISSAWLEHPIGSSLQVLK